MSAALHTVKSCSGSSRRDARMDMDIYKASLVGPIKESLLHSSLGGN